MIDEVKTNIEVNGFYQVIDGPTRQWPGVDDSQIDHCWLNVPGKVIQKHNIVNVASDHNIIGINLRVKGVAFSNLELKKRRWSNFNTEIYNKRLEEINWDKLNKFTNIDLPWNFFETSVKSILDKLAPIVKVQPSARYKNWVKMETKNMMTERDVARVKAKETGNADDWRLYRTLRNKVFAEIKRNRSDFYKAKYQEYEEEKDTSKLFKLAKKQLGWKTSGPPTSLLKNGTVVTAPQEMAQVQMEYFHEEKKKIGRRNPSGS